MKTVALFRLEEAKQRRLEYLEYGDEDSTFEPERMSVVKGASPKVAEDVEITPVEVPAAVDSTTTETESLFLQDDEAILRRARMERRRERRKSVSDGVAVMATLHAPVDLTRVESKPEPVVNKSRINSGDIMAELVKLDTSSLRSAVPESPEQRTLRHERMRKNRRKAASTGVSAMVFPDPVFEAEHEMSEEIAEERKSSRTKGKRVKSLSAGVSAMFWFGKDEVNGLSKTDKEPQVTFEDEAGDKVEVDSDATVDGYVSDEDNLPSFSPLSDIADILPPLRERLKAFLLSERYIFLSNVFGTIVAFPTDRRAC